MKTATVKDVIQVKKWDGPKGTLYFHTIVLDNGDKGSVGKKSEGAIKIGDTLNYTIDGDRIKEVQQNGFGGNGNGGGRHGGNASFALSYAKDICVANINKADKPLEMSQALAEKVTTVAEVFKQWLDSHP